MVKKKALKIAMFFSSDPAAAGGVQEQLLFLSRALIKLGHTVDVYGPQGNKFPFSSYAGICNIVPFVLPNGNTAHFTAKNTQTDAFIDRIIDAKYDIIHVHEPYIPFVGWDLVRRAAHTPVIGTFHTAWDDTSVLRTIDSGLSLLKELYTSFFSGTIYVSHLTAERWHPLVKPEAGHPEKIIGLGIDGRFKPKKIDIDDQVAVKKRTKLLFVGRLVTRKGAHHLLESLVEVIKKVPAAALTIVGDGEQRASLEQLAKKLNLENHVVFVGEVMGKERIRYFQEAQVFCAPYTDEAFGLTVVEAMACGCPTVGFDNHAFDETLAHYPKRTELLVPYKDTDKLSKAIVRALTDDALYVQLQKWCLKQSKLYSWKQHALQTELFYRDALNNAS